MGMIKKSHNVLSDYREESIEEHTSNMIAVIMLIVIVAAFFVGLSLALNRFVPEIIKIFS